MATIRLYTYQRHITSGSDSEDHEVLLGLHRAASLLERLTLDNLQGSIGEDRPEVNLVELTFRFNRRYSRDQGLLFYRLTTLAATTPTHAPRISPGQRSEADPTNHVARWNVAT